MTKWLKQNAWSIIVAVAILIFGWATLSARVTANEIRIINVENKVAKYPSEDYFDLKFLTIEEKIAIIKADLEKYRLEVR
uniref:Uncharacterized protein n=1 Tax=viral metagenome TaxID=1070528 RepID=A0A6M3IGB8_9ZZZZ